MTGFRGWLLATLLAAGLAATCGCGRSIAQQPTPAHVCGGEKIAHGIVSHIIDGRTLVLDDGREVRLAGVEVPPLPQGTGNAPGGTEAKAALEALAGGDEVVLDRAEMLSDRYGRIVTYAYTERDGDELFVQGELIASGFARVSNRIDGGACAAQLLGRENVARKTKSGLWGDSYFNVLDAAAPADVLAHQGRFALVEGTVLSVRESGSTIYLNFGRRWSEDFTVAIQKRNERNFTAAGLDVKGLAGRRLRVRGFIEARGATAGSPWIVAEHPDQIEIAERE
jgi:endonuclease YncB( thermonuclease family)